MKQVELTISVLIRKTDDPEQYAKIFRETMRKVFDSQADVRLSDTEAVNAFHLKFGVPMSDIPELPSPEVYDFRHKFLQEELNEFREGYEEKNLHKMADALIDLVYVAQGTALMMGLPWSALWGEVQRANMSKVRATHADQSKRKSTLDVVKPAGWKAPDFTGILGEEYPTC